MKQTNALDPRLVGGHHRQPRSGMHFTWLCLVLLLTQLLPLWAEKAAPASSSSAIATDTAAEERMPDELRKLREMLKEGDPSFTAADVEREFPRIVPLVEKATGKKFKKVPTWKISDRREVAEVLAADILPQLDNLLPQATAEQRREIGLRQAKSMAALMLGKYGFSDKQLYLLPRNFLPLFRITHVPVDQVAGILQLIIAHELTHAMQDQEIDLLARISNIKDSETGLAFNSTIEGHAVLTMEQVGHELGLASSVIEASKLFAAGSVEFDDPALQMMNKVMSSQYESIYLGGKRFIEYWAKKSGPAMVWEILKTPPTRTSVIMSPPSYAASGEIEDADIPLKQWMEGLETMLGSPPVQVQSVEVGTMNLAAAWANMNPQKRDELLAGIVKTHALVVVATASASMGNVSIMVLRDSAKAPSFIAALEEMAMGNLKQLQVDQSSLKVTDITLADFPVEQASPSRRFAFTIGSKGDPGTQKQIIYRIVIGHLLVEIFDGNVGIPEKDVREIARRIRTAYEKHLHRTK